MYKVLLLCDETEEEYHVSDFLTMAGISVAKRNVDKKFRLERTFFYDVIIMECNVTEGRFERFCELRRMFFVPILMVSKEEKEYYIIRAFQAGVDDYITAPFSAVELVARVKCRAKRYTDLVVPKGYMEGDGFSIDIGKRIVTVDGNKIDLRSKEFDIVAYLAMNAGKAIPKLELYHAVWKRESEIGAENIIAVHMRRIRMKLGDDADCPRFIETVWTVGYRFMPEVKSERLTNLA